VDETNASQIQRSWIARLAPNRNSLKMHVS
jgi:hypothetical protein